MPAVPFPALARLRAGPHLRVAALVLGAMVAMLVGAGIAQVALRVAATRPTVLVSADVPALLPAPSRTAAAAPPHELLASPAAGTTGTAPLPPVPPAALVEAAGNTVVAARPFSLTGVAPADRARALECLTAAVYYEAASEPDAGQRAVAQVVLNRVRHPAFPATVCGVVYQGSERAGCQFSFACDGAMARGPSRSGWARAARNAAAVLGGATFAPVGLATHYHTFAVTPAWNRTLVMTAAVGAHFFHRWKGYWGTSVAFVQRYRGNEPTPGPHASAAATTTAPVIAPVVPVTPDTFAVATPSPVPTPRPVLAPAPQVQPAHETSGQPLVPALPPSSQVLDRWKDSGRPLR